MSEPQQILGLGLTKPAEVPAVEQLPAPESLQFRRAESTPEYGIGAQTCNACKRSFEEPYFHVNGAVVCPACANAIEVSQQAPSRQSLLKAFIYGLGAAVAGSALYAAVAIIADLQLALIAILIGYMVGKAVRHASGGLGGRPQQVMAVLLTYFSITTSYIPVVIHHYATNPQIRTVTAAQQQPPPQTGTSAAPTPAPHSRPQVSLGQALVGLLLLALAAPFLALNSMGGVLSLLIIFFGLQRAWRMTGRSELVVTGPYHGA